MTRPGSDVSLHKIQSKARGNVVKMSGMILEKKNPVEITKRFFFFFS